VFVLLAVVLRMRARRERRTAANAQGTSDLAESGQTRTQGTNRTELASAIAGVGPLAVEISRPAATGPDVKG
jgi:hypothetical protein